METHIQQILDYESELTTFCQRIGHNEKTCSTILTSCSANIKDCLVTQQNLYKKDEDKVVDLEVKIESLRESIKNVVGNKDRVGREYQQLSQELEQLQMETNKKIKERDINKERLEEVKKHLNEKEQITGEVEKKKQKKIKNAEKALSLYTTHLGVRIETSKSQRQSLIFIMTQINKSNPTQEFILELRLEDDNYHIMNTVPQLPNIQSLEDRLNQANNWKGFILHVRKLFQEISKK